jgi:hypothetical protein
MSHTKKLKRQRPQLVQALSLFIAGAGIGWLTGLSVSPVVSIVVTSIAGIGAGAVTGLQSMQSIKNQETEDAGKRFDARPAAIFILGIALMAPCGILARTYHVFEPAHVSELQVKTVVDKKNDQDRGVLFSKYEDDCGHVLSLVAMKNDEGVIKFLSESTMPEAKTLALEFKDDQKALARILEIICNYYQPKEGSIIQQTGG